MSFEVLQKKRQHERSSKYDRARATIGCWLPLQSATPATASVTIQSVASKTLVRRHRWRLPLLVSRLAVNIVDCWHPELTLRKAALTLSLQTVVTPRAIWSDFVLTMAALRHRQELRELLHLCKRSHCLTAYTGFSQRRRLNPSLLAVVTKTCVQYKPETGVYHTPIHAI